MFQTAKKAREELVPILLADLASRSCSPITFADHVRQSRSPILFNVVFEPEADNCQNIQRDSVSRRRSRLREARIEAASRMEPSDAPPRWRRSQCPTQRRRERRCPLLYLLPRARR